MLQCFFILLNFTLTSITCICVRKALWHARDRPLKFNTGSCFYSLSAHTQSHHLHLFILLSPARSLHYHWHVPRYAQALSVRLVGRQQCSVDGLHTGRAGEGAHEPGVNAVHVIDVHAGQEPDWVAVLKVHHADHTPGGRCQTFLLHANYISFHTFLDVPWVLGV